MRFSIDKARDFLRLSGIFYYDSLEEAKSTGDYDTDEDAHRAAQEINFNDTWCWASSWGEEVPDEDLPELARLFWCYGWAGVLYYGSQKNEGMRSEFHDNNRFIEFVRNEENIRKDFPDSDKRAYYKATYTLGEPR